MAENRWKIAQNPDVQKSAKNAHLSKTCQTLVKWQVFDKWLVKNLSKTCHFSIKISTSQKMHLGCHLVPKVLQSDPKGLQNGALGGHLGHFFCKKPTLHPTAYLLCFRNILEVLGSPVLRKFLLEMCVGSRSPKKAVTLSLVLIFRRKCVKMGAQMGGAEVPETALFLIGPPLGAPGFIVIAFCTPWAAFWHPFGCPWVHFC